MKNLLIFTLLVLLCINSFGQRVCDLETHILLPDSGNLFESPGPNKFDIIIINKGPDALSSREFIGIGLWVQGRHLILDAVELKAAGLDVNDTLFYKRSIEFLYKQDQKDVNVCVNRCYAHTYKGVSDTVYREREGDSLYLNNTDCVHGDVDYTLSTLDQVLSKTELGVYPNPVSDKLFFKNDFVGEQVTITNVSGSVVLNDHVSTENNFSMKGIPAGVYVVTIHREDGALLRRKIVKMKE